MVGAHHSLERRGERALRIGEEGGDPRERLFFLGVENVQNRTDEQRVAGFLPVISALERPFRIDENIGDILNVANLVLAATDLEQRVVFGGRRIGRKIGRASCRERVCQSVYISVVAVALKTKL